ncbi:glycerophosphodiester phosphodiesterase family protein [Mucilaginibacter sp. BJC16-A38]|uniref:glycerophosphodiester phosphodiesterase family protein n=1 Tax=Mucilaginibacter phenanthrenivorans TaxID=1234842 RepID=UPI002158811B|nr:glycerophosphodiester phosphodiesterase family protein [Mucilaginibacter phenanthrenivorans]MCR8561088.1 glycerophosphodiester phosphodiesterase family protein [Mucilaginibacter phenanthrenivorans]
MKLITLLPILFLLAVKANCQPNPTPAARHKYIVVAHRGDHTVYPENTLEGYASTIKDGADYIEIDLRTTSDGKLVSMHDASINRMTENKGLIKDLTMQQIGELKVRVKGKPDTTTYRVPTFEQILKLCRDKIYIYIDFKEADATATLNLLKQYHMEKQVLVYINKASQITDWRKTDPSMPLMLSMPDSVKDADSMKKFIDSWHPDVLDGNYNTYTKEMLEFAATLNLPVWPDAQGPLEGPAVWDKVIAIGLKGVQTDNPPALIKYLEGKGLR